ncbi:calcineurin-like phosphoesterase family protein [Umezawaea tangerina]|uniref:Calcineurin-like phosphoesterase family protein n=1 Tax=Umezawaea tangerina TaxID=84725 RepID=A0A2T0TMG2_9PSEU|nr:calcineurin-like phosphoesterase family protein [Umezawaea tangerina]
MNLSIPDLSLVVLLGARMAGALPADRHDEIDRRLRAGGITVVDATGATRQARAELVVLAKRRSATPVAVAVGATEWSLREQGFRRVHVLADQAAVDAVRFEVERLPNDLRELTGPFDAIGDVHGCRVELEELLRDLGYGIVHDDRLRAVDAVHPDGRTVLFVGDLVDRGPDTPGVLRLAMGMVAAGRALVVRGNHEDKLVKALRGNDVRMTHGLAESMAQLGRESAGFRGRVLEFCSGLVPHYVLDGGALVVAHAGLPEKYHGRESSRTRSLAIWGENTGEVDEAGNPVRYPWAEEYSGAATVLYGHTPVAEARWVNGTMCLDTGCVFGGRLSALRYPEREVVWVPARRRWFERAGKLV